MRRSAQSNRPPAPGNALVPVGNEGRRFRRGQAWERRQRPLQTLPDEDHLELYPT